MSSSGRFRSQFFSGISQRSLKWRDRLQQVVRQAKLAALWGLQISVYPVYAAFQSVRLLDRQLKKATHRAAPSLQSAKRALKRITRAQPTLPPPQADTPIRQILHTAKTLVPSALLRSLQHTVNPTLPDGGISQAIGSAGTALAIAQENTLASPVPAIIVNHGLEPLQEPLGAVQGIASLLATRALVLTTTGNHILDILTPDQQQHLHHRIIWELAEYGYYHRLATTIPSHTLPLPSDRPTLLPPVRAFRRLMAWMQTSDIALATNLFGEVALVRGQLWQRQAIASVEPLPEPSLMPTLPSALTRPIPDSLPQQWMHPDASEPRLIFQPVSPPAPASPPPPQTIAPASTPLQPIAAANLPQAQEERSIAVVPYIDTKATLVKYERHPLEQLLQWLDSGMVWIEEKVAQAYRWLQTVWK